MFLWVSSYSTIEIIGSTTLSIHFQAVSATTSYAEVFNNL